MGTPMSMVYNFSMRRAVAASLAVAFLFGVKSCGDPYGSAKDRVEDFMEEIREKEGMEAVRYLHPTFRDTLVRDLKLPVQFTEMKPSEVLACLLSSMGSGIKDVEVGEGTRIDDRTVKLKVRVKDRNELEKIFNFVLVREEEEWFIADITPYTLERK